MRKLFSLLLMLGVAYSSFGLANDADNNGSSSSDGAAQTRMRYFEFCPEGQHWDADMQMCMPDETGKINLMIHGNQFFFVDTQSGPRGSTKLSAPSMEMADLSFQIQQHNILVINVMTDADYWLVPKGGTPELLQVGDVHNNGMPFVDHQHPHSSPIMGLTISDILDLTADGKKKVIFFFAPRGEATAGPMSYMHRPSAVGNPFTPLSHHLQDSFHVTSTVVGTNLDLDKTSVEVSGFSGRDPAPDRINLDMHPIDSFGVRVNHMVTDHVTVGGSYASVYEQSPEGIPAPSEPTERNQYVSSWVSTSHNFKSGSLNTSTIYGQEFRPNQPSLTSFLEELAYEHSANRFYGRVEILQRTPEQLLIAVTGNPNDPRWVQAYTGGYERALVQKNSYTLYGGAAYTRDAIPQSFEGAYGRNLNGAAVGVRVNFKKGWAWIKNK